MHLSACWHARQRIGDNKVSKREISTVVFDSYICWCDWNLGGWHALLYTINKYRGITIMVCAIARHFLSWMTMVGQPEWGRRHDVFILQYSPKNPLRPGCGRSIPVYLWLVGDNLFPNSLKPRLESYDSPFVRYRSITSRCSGFI